MNKFNLLVLFMTALALFSCKNKEEQEPEPEPVIESKFKTLISVTDGTLEDWKAIPSEYLTIIRKDPQTVVMGGLDSIYVYADKYYMYLQVWYRGDSLSKRDLVPFHIYLNADNNLSTGGYEDHFSQATAASEWLLEGYLFQGNNPVEYNPALFLWWGAKGTGIKDQSNKTGWWWTNPGITPGPDNGWGAIISTDETTIGKSQALNQNKVFEIQIKRMDIINAAKNMADQSLVDGWTWADTFTVGFGLEMSLGEKTWVTQGILPSTIEDFGFPVKGDMAKVKIDPSNHN